MILKTLIEYQAREIEELKSLCCDLSQAVADLQDGDDYDDD